MPLSQEQIREVSCVVCGAKPKEYCRQQGRNTALLECHPQRTALRSKLGDLTFDKSLDATDKALITYYGYVMICDAVAANSEKMFGEGKVFTSQEVQQFFARKAINELREDGLLDK